jgi:hypothetical protein
MFSLIAALVVQFRNAFADRRDVLLENAALLTEYVEHYNGGRPHRALELTAPEPRPRPLKPPVGGTVVARPVLGGLHHEYSWEAA